MNHGAKVMMFDSGLEGLMACFRGFRGSISSKGYNEPLKRFKPIKHLKQCLKP